MRESQRRLLTELRHALLPLHRTLLEWERAAYERVHGQQGAANSSRSSLPIRSSPGCARCLS